MNEGKFRLVALDMDGTIFRSDRTISPRMEQVLNRLGQQGIQVVLCTGRIYTTANRWAAQWGIDGPIICSNGANVRSEHKVYYEATLDGESIAFCKDVAQDFGSCFFAFCGDHVHCTQRDVVKELFEKWDVDGLRAQGLDLICVEDDYETLVQRAANKAVKLLIVESDPLRHSQIKKQLQTWKKISVCSSESDNIDIMPTGQSKGKALKWLCQDLKIPREQVLAIGDGENDVDMIQFAGCGVAMGNAMDVVKKEADYVALTNDQDGAALAIQKFVLGEDDAK